MSFHNQMVDIYGEVPGWVYRPKLKKYSTPICGIGTNDVPFIVSTSDGYKGKYPLYELWTGILRRCNDWDLNKHPTYKGVVSSKEFESLHSFILAMKDKYIPGYSLDKDLLIRGNKIYSANTVIFVPKEINNFLVRNDINRGNKLLGVSTHTHGRLQAQIKLDGKTTNLGLFDSELEAHQAWQKAKIKQAKVLKERYSIPEMQLVIDRLQNDLDNNIVTEVI